ncbi:MAG: hypothetical protein KAW17_10570 [Candidatus Eisenbacteria sp.]|nr:hypothetical protein [Candidatus Eisenbacteria bacterium]
MKYLALFLVCVLALACQSQAYNGQESLAMHLVASYEYLDCPDLCPLGTSCLDVDCDLTPAELEVSGGYGYVVFLAYNVDEITQLEFYVVGWPLGPGTPDFAGPFYCAGEDAFVLGEAFEKRGGAGGAVSWPWCEEPCSKLHCFAYIAFGPEIFDWLPINLEYAPSSFSYPADPHNFVQDCTTFEEGLVYHEHGAVIGGECDPIPNCEPGPTPSSDTTWGTIKSLYR